MYITKSDTARLLRDFKDPAVGSNPWQNAYNLYDELANQVNQEVAASSNRYALQEQRDNLALGYDYSKAVSEAYAAAQANRNAIFDTNLFSGYKQDLVAQNQANLQTAYEQYKSNYLSKQSDMKSQYDNAQSKLQEYRQNYLSNLDAAKGEVSANLERYSDNINNYLNSHYDYLTYLYENNPDAFNANAFRQFLNTDGTLVSRDAFDKLISKEIYSDTGEMIRELSKEGVNILNTIENYSDDSLGSIASYLYDNDRELSTWLNEGLDEYGRTVTGADLFRNLVGMKVYKDPGNDYKDYRNVKFIENDTFKINPEDIVTTELTTQDGNTVKIMDLKDDDIKEEMKERTFTVDKTKSWTPTEFKRDIESIVGGQAGKAGGKRDAIVNAVVEAANNGTLADGTVFSANYGGGTNADDFYIYRNSRFYRLDGGTTFTEALKATGTTEINVSPEAEWLLYAMQPDEIGKNAWKNRKKNFSEGKTIPGKIAKLFKK